MQNKKNKKIPTQLRKFSYNSNKLCTVSVTEITRMTCDFDHINQPIIVERKYKKHPVFTARQFLPADVKIQFQNLQVPISSSFIEYFYQMSAILLLIR